LTPDYAKLIAELKAGTRAEIKITPAEFGAFRAVWTNYPERKEIVGTAGRGGEIIYHYQPVQ
jgi:hypothetical protein